MANNERNFLFPNELLNISNGSIFYEMDITAPQLLQKTGNTPDGLDIYVREFNVDFDESRLGIDEESSKSMRQYKVVDLAYLTKLEEFLGVAYLATAK